MPEKTERKVVHSLSELSQLAGLLKENEAPASMQIKTAQSTAPEVQSFAHRDAWKERRNPTYNIVSTVAYLLGVEQRHFENVHEPPQQKIYERLQTDPNARIIRNLCVLRNAMYQKYEKIAYAFRMEGRSLGTIPALIPSQSITELHADGVSMHMGRPHIDEYLIRINQELSNRIHTVAAFFPEWVKWEYIKPLFLTPNGTKRSGVQSAGEAYNTDRNRYPYQCWLNWAAVSVGTAGQGNILYTDEKFLRILYERHEDSFDNLSLVRDAGNQTMRNLTRLLGECEKCIVVVDCENSDAVKLAAALSSLPRDELRKISKVLLFDSEYTTPEWSKLVDRRMNVLRDSTRCEGDDGWMRLEHMIVPRLNQSKSQVDMTLAVRTSREVYSGGVDAVILVSSDSDYWAMIQQLEGTRFLVMLETEKTGLAIIDMLTLHSIPHCFLDDFCTGASYKIKSETLIDEIQSRIDAILRGEAKGAINVRTLLDACLKESWIEMTAREKEAFYDRYLRKMKLSVQVDGQVRINIE